MAGPRSRPQQRRAHEMRERLLDVTVALLERDPAGVTTTAIAQAAHVSIGTVYRYFGDRDEIVAVLLERAMRAIYNDLTTAVGAAMAADGEAATRIVVETLTAAFERHAAVLRAVAEQGANLETAETVERTLFPLARVIPALHRPDLSASELDDLVFVTMGLTADGCLRIALRRPPAADRAALIDHTARMLAAALQPPAVA